ncbi:MAG: amidohydrolase family protein [Candidatus Omnitrophica bacterium]|nr:amidohydrolase family protein [Candidatus Omnitrophota bacterium]
MKRFRMLFRIIQTVLLAPVLGIISIDSPSEFSKQLQQIKNLGLKGLSLSSSYNGRYLDDEMFFPVYEFAAKEKFPIHVHPQIIGPIGEERVKDPLLTPVLEYMFDVSICIGKMMMSGIFDKFKNVIFIFAHYGGVIPFVKERFDNTYQMLRGRNFVKDIGKKPSEFFANLYFETSGSQSAAALACALEVASPEHILFGSDYPANQHIIASIDVVKKSRLSTKEKEAILFKNAKKFFLEK